MDHHAPPQPAHSHESPPAWEPPMHHPPSHRDPPGYDDPPFVPPPSYDDSTNPLLGGVPPTYSYGTWQERDDDSSTASTEVETSDSGCHECVGHVVVVAFYVAIIYGFWSLLRNPPDGLNHFPGYDPNGHPRPG